MSYVRIYQPDHPLANTDGRVLEHRLVVYESGVEIPKGHVVHHINGAKDDNRLENLEVMTYQAHNQHHLSRRNDLGYEEIVALCESGLTYREFATIGVAKSRVTAAKKALGVPVGVPLTHCKHGHEFTPENTRHNKRGGRSCRVCRAHNQRQYCERLRAVA